MEEIQSTYYGAYYEPLKELEQEGLNPEEYLEQKVETAKSREEEILAAPQERIS